MKATVLAEALRRDRERRKRRKRHKPQTQQPTVSRAAPDFDPFSVRRWRVVAGGDPGYLVKTPMRSGPVDWFIACGHCGAEFESKGWKYCPTCMELSAEERRSKPALSDRMCLRCSRPIPVRRRADAKYCCARCAKTAENGRKLSQGAHPQFRGDTREITQQNQGPKNVLVGPGDFPINVIGGQQFPEAHRLDPALRREIVKAESLAHQHKLAVTESPGVVPDASAEAPAPVTPKQEATP
jgi:hypothetical protein